MQYFGRFVTKLTNAFFYLSIVGLVLLVSISTMEIISRYFFNYSFTWNQEFALLLICWIVFPGFGKVVAEGEDIVLSFFINKFPKRGYRLIKIVNASLLLLTSSYMLVKSYELMIQQINKVTPIIELPYPLFVLPLIIVLGIVALQSLHELLSRLLNVQKDLDKGGV